MRGFQMNAALADAGCEALLPSGTQREEPRMPDSLAAALSPAVQAYRAGRLAEALPALQSEAAAATDPDQELALMILAGNSLLKLGRTEEAMALYFRVWTRRHQLKSRDPLTLQFNLGLCARRLGRREQAELHLRQVVEQAGDTERELLGRAWRELAALWRPVDRRQALACSRRSLEIWPPEEGGPPQQVERLALAWASGDDEEVLRRAAELEGATLTPEQRRRCLAHELMALVRLGRWPELVHRFSGLEDHLREDEHAVDLFATAGLAARESGDEGSARRWLDEARRIYARSGRIQQRELLEALVPSGLGAPLEELPFEQLEEFGIVGVSPPVIQLKNQLRRIRGGRLPVLVTGESGSGKELVARSFVEPGRPFVPVNCRAVPPQLFPTLLFGHARGAFTGAAQTRGGWVEEADGGVLFLDEVGDLPLEVQPMLFRFLDDGGYYRVGEQVERRARVRVVAATNLDLRDGARMRRELRMRLAGFEVCVPPLRERGDDLLYLAGWFVRRWNEEHGARRTLGPDPEETLRSWHYPGNVRELRFLLQRACTLSEDDCILPSLEQELARARLEAGGDSPAHDLEPDGGARARSTPFGPGFSLQRERRRFEEMLRRRALSATGGNARAAARLLGESPTGILRMLAKERIEG
jgi:DNA-binding NtrC family response regulator